MGEQAITIITDVFQYFSLSLNELAKIPLAASFLGAIVGSSIGFCSARWLEFRRERRQRAAVVWAIFSEMALLSSTLETAAEDGHRIRDDLKKPYWDKFGTELILFLPLAIDDDG